MVVAHTITYILLRPGSSSEAVRQGLPVTGVQNVRSFNYCSIAYGWLIQRSSTHACTAVQQQEQHEHVVTSSSTPCRIDLYPTAYLRLQKWHFTIRCHTGPICSSAAREIRSQRCTGTSLHACYHIHGSSFSRKYVHILASAMRYTDPGLWGRILELPILCCDAPAGHAGMIIINHHHHHCRRSFRMLFL